MAESNEGHRKHMNSIGIIVPVYNVKEKYLRECIDSLIGQTYANIKIYIVDDRSEDWCRQVCDDIGELDKRIKVIHHEVNKGLPGARNTGMKHCDTDWITFVDSDDWVDLDMCERFIRYLGTSGNRPDIYMFSGYRSYPDHEEGNKNNGEIRIFRSREEIKQLQRDAMTTFVTGKPDNTIPFESAWGRIFLRSYLTRNKLEFRELPFREDGMFFQEVTEYTGNIVYSPDLLYHYRMCRNSMVNSYRKNAPQELEKYLEMLWAFAEKKHKEKEYYHALYGAAFFAMQTVITNYYYHPKCPLNAFARRRECKKYFEKPYFREVYKSFPLRIIKRNHRIKMILLRMRLYYLIRVLRDVYLHLHRQTCFP